MNSKWVMSSHWMRICATLGLLTAAIPVSQAVEAYTGTASDTWTKSTDADSDRTNRTPSRRLFPVLNPDAPLENESSAQSEPKTFDVEATIERAIEALDGRANRSQSAEFDPPPESLDGATAASRYSGWLAHFACLRHALCAEAKTGNDSDAGQDTLQAARLVSERGAVTPERRWPGRHAEGNGIFPTCRRSWPPKFAIALGPLPPVPHRPGASNRLLVDAVDDNLIGTIGARIQFTFNSAAQCRTPGFVGRSS